MLLDMAKYDGLRTLLEQSGEHAVELSFPQVDVAVGGLPRSAYEHQAWWGNHAVNPQAKAWMSLGRRVEMISLPRVASRIWCNSVDAGS